MSVRVRDPIHNFISLNDKQVKLVGTQAFQRLRGIRQLALANLVYPGALHTRFDHTLGVTHVAGLMAEALGLKEEIQLVQHAALLHDLGHGPFSHVSENALMRYADPTKIPEGQKKEKIHELITARIIQQDEEIVKILSKDTCDQVVRLLGKGHGQPALRSIVSGPLDADKQDYLLRDSYFCGVQYGVFDIHQLHRSLVLVGDKHEEELMIDSDGIHAVEQFVLAKYYLTSNVYRHRVRLITDQMIVRAIVLGIEMDKNEELHRLYAFDNSDEFVKHYQKWDDARFMATFAQNATTRCGQMLQRLVQRNLLKRVFLEKVQEFKAEVREKIMSLSKKPNDGIRADIEAGAAEFLAKHVGQEVFAPFVIVHAFDIKSVRESSKNEEAGISVNKPTPRPFLEESTLFRSINEGYDDQFVEVYAPVSWKDRGERSKLRRTCREPILQLIEAKCAMIASQGAKP